MPVIIIPYPFSYARIWPGVNLGSDELGRMDPAVPARDTTGVPRTEGPIRPCDVVGLESCGVDAREWNGLKLAADCARDAMGVCTRLACISILGSQ